MRVLHIVPSFYPATVYGGPIESVYQLCRSIAKHKCDVRVLTTNANGKGKDLPVAVNVDHRLDELEIRYCKRVAADSISLQLLDLLPSKIQWADIVHITAAYSFPVIPALLISKIYGKPVVWSPRGAFQRWEGSTKASVKRCWELLCNMLCDANRVILHVTSEKEKLESIRKVTRLVAKVIPNGIDCPSNLSAREWLPNGQMRLLFIGRLHPKKGLENLIHALTKLDQTIILTICGDGDTQYKISLKLLVKELGLERRVLFAGHVSNELKYHFFAKADLCIVPSHTENFGMVVAESLSYGVPVVASRGTPWERIESIACGLWVENDPGSLAEAIILMRQMPLHQMGQLGRDWMLQEFSWEEKAQEMLQLYDQLIAKC